MALKAYRVQSLCHNWDFEVKGSHIIVGQGGFVCIFQDLDDESPSHVIPAGWLVRAV